MSDTPTVVILAGGENSRFFPLNTGTHKGGRTIAGVSLIERCITDLMAHDFDKIRVVVSDKDFGGQGLSGNIAQGVEYVLQPKPQGQADAVIQGTKGIDGDCIVVSPYYLNAGAISQQLVRKKIDSRADCVVLASKTDQPDLYGMLELKDDQVVSVAEKPTGASQSRMKVNSFYLFNAEFLEKLRETESSQYALETVLNSFAHDRVIKIIESDKQPLSLKFSWQLLEFTEQILSSQKSSRDPSAQIAATAVIDESTGPVVIAANAVIKDFSVISGPCYIGENVLIGEYSFIRGSAVESYAKVGANAEIVRSLIMPAVTIHAGYCSDSILGERTTGGAGLITANLRLDNADVQITVADKKRSTKQRKLGLITGDDVHLGVRVTSMPGTLVGEKSTIYPGLTISHSVESNSVMKS